MRNENKGRKSNVAPQPAGRHSTFDPFISKTFFLSLLLVSFLMPAHAQQIEGLVNIRFAVDARLFAVMAAINAAGFDDEASPAGMSRVRKQVHEELVSLSPSLREKLRTFYASHKPGGRDKAQPSKYVSFSLWIQGPPRFDLTAKRDDLPPDVRSLIGFEALLAEFYREANIERLWEKVKPQYIAEIERYRPIIRETIVETLGYLRSPARIVLDRQIIFIPDLLGPKGVSHAFNIADSYYLVVGPAAQPEDNKEEIRHEYMHFLVDPLVGKYAGIILRHTSLQKVAEQRPHFEEKYRNDFSLVVTESFIKAVHLRMAKANDHALQQRLFEAYDSGLILVYHFMEALRRYEADGMAFNEYFPEMLKSIDVEAETKRPASVAQAMEAFNEGRVKLENQEKKEERVREALRESNKLLQSRDYEKARVKLEEVLKLNPANSSACFGLGQIESQQKNYEKAIEYYRRAAESNASSPWIVAWSRLKRGRILAGHYNKEEEALTEFEKILTIKGDVRGADEEARKEIQRIRKQFDGI